MEVHPHQTNSPKLSGFGQVGAVVDDTSWTERDLNQDNGLGMKSYSRQSSKIICAPFSAMAYTVAWR